MKLILSFLQHSSLMRITAVWLMIGIISVSVFWWRVGIIRSDLAEKEDIMNIYKASIQKLDEERNSQKEEELKQIIDKLDHYRPSVPQLLEFVEKIETLANSKGTNALLYTIKNTSNIEEGTKGQVNYNLELTAPIDQIKDFIKDFENEPYAITVKSMKISPTPKPEKSQDSLDTNEISNKKNIQRTFDLNISFILNTKIT